MNEMLTSKSSGNYQRFECEKLIGMLTTFLKQSHLPFLFTTNLVGSLAYPTRMRINSIQITISSLSLTT